MELPYVKAVFYQNKARRQVSKRSGHMITPTALTVLTAAYYASLSQPSFSCGWIWSKLQREAYEQIKYSTVKRWINTMIGYGLITRLHTDNKKVQYYTITPASLILLKQYNDTLKRCRHDR